MVMTDPPPPHALEPPEHPAGPQTMHYPRRVSKIKRVRNLGFRARMKTKAGRRMINRKRRKGRRVTPLDS